MPKQVTLTVRPGKHDRFEVSDGAHVLGTSQNEMMAVWSAIAAAREMAKSGDTVRVVMQEGASLVEQFVARPPSP